MFTWSEDVKSLPGPIGVKYDDSMTVLKIHLVVLGIKEKRWFALRILMCTLNTTTSNGLSVLLEVFKLNKKTIPPMKTVLEKRFFEMPKCPSKILSVDYKLKKDQCILSVRKSLPGLWTNSLSL
ncbi:hypothetical protein DINM_002283 [Dirofilaria immitis]|nr:hypothetical protein [Dirofilaria immitis]